MNVEFNPKLVKRTIDFCEDELEYHIDESGCANEYHGEILAEIEILFLLGEKERALDFAELYLESSQNDYYVSEKIDKKQKKEIKDLIKKIKNV